VKRFTALLICVCISGALLLWNGSRSGTASASDDRAVLQLSESLISGERNVAFKYGASLDGQLGTSRPFHSEKEFKQAGKKLCEAMQFTVDSATDNSNDASFACGDNGDSWSAQLKFTLLADRSAYLFVLLKTRGDAKEIESLIERRKAADNRLSGLGIGGTWNTIVNGSLEGSPKSASDRIVKQIKATEVERYTEGGTEIIAYRSPELHAQVASGKEHINLQAAIWRHTDTGTWSITLGTPVITGEIGG
jgi:hypothetical protein